MDLLTLTAIIVLVAAAAWLGYLLGKAAMRRRLSADVEAIRADAVKRSRSVLAGQFSEQLAPFLPDFPWRPTEARFIGKPVDFIVFKGLDGKAVSEIVFVEVKSGKSSLSGTERSLRDAVREKRVIWAEYRVPDDVTKGKEE